MKKPALTLDMFVSAFHLPLIQATKRSWNLDERVLRQHISPNFGQINLADIKSASVACWFSDLLASGLAPATCNRIMAVFRSAMTHAQRLDYIESSPCSGLGSLPEQGRERPLTPSEACHLMAELKKHDRAEAYALRLLLLTGARKSEIIHARWENIDLVRKTLLVPLAKSGKPRTILLSNEAVAILRKIKKSDSPWLFPGRKADKPISDIYGFWNKIRQKLKLDGVRIHDLRHTFASFLVESGHTLFETQKLLGHSEPRATMRYAHLGWKNLFTAVERVSSIMLKSKKGAAIHDKIDCPFLALFYQSGFGKMFFEKKNSNLY